MIVMGCLTVGYGTRHYSSESQDNYNSTLVLGQVKESTQMYMVVKPQRTGV